MDDLFKRGLVALAIFFGGLLFVLLMMKVGGVKPMGLAAHVFSGIEILLKAVAMIVGAVVVMIAIVGIYSEIEDRAKEKANQEKRIEQERINAENRRLNEIRYAREEREKKRQKAEEDRLWQEELRKREIEKAKYLKTRSAADANRDALKDFL